MAAYSHVRCRCNAFLTPCTAPLYRSSEQAINFMAAYGQVLSSLYPYTSLDQACAAGSLTSNVPTATNGNGIKLKSTVQVGAGTNEL